MNVKLNKQQKASIDDLKSITGNSCPDRVLMDLLQKVNWNTN